MGTLSTKIIDHVMTPAQCRAARALLGITQSQLAAAAGLGLSTVVDFEKERRRVSDDAIQDMQIILQRAGIAFRPATLSRRVYCCEGIDDIHNESNGVR